MSATPSLFPDVPDAASAVLAGEVPREHRGTKAAPALVAALDRRAVGPDVRRALVSKVEKKSRRMAGGRAEVRESSAIWPGEEVVTPGDPYTAAEVRRHVVSTERRDAEAYVSMAYYSPDEPIGRGADPERPKAAPRGRAAGIAYLSSFWADLDDDSDAHADTDGAGWAAGGVADLTEHLVEQFGRCVTAVVSSGHGWHMHIRYDRPLTPDADRDVRLRLNRVVQAFADERGLHHEASVTLDQNRVLRLPGTTNRKSPGDLVGVDLLHLDGDAEISVDQVLADLPEPSAEEFAVYERGTGGEIDESTPWGAADAVDQVLYDLIDRFDAEIGDRDPAPVTPCELSRGEDGVLVVGEPRVRSAGNLIRLANGALAWKIWSDPTGEALRAEPSAVGGYSPLTGSELWLRVPPLAPDGTVDRGLGLRILARRGPRVSNLLAAIEGKTYDELRTEFPSRDELDAQRADGLDPEDRGLVRDFDQTEGAAVFALSTLDAQQDGDVWRLDGDVYEVRGLDVHIDGRDESVRAFHILSVSLGREAALDIVRKAVA